MDNAERIERFTKMAEADPDNELGHFSLGKALAEDGQYAEAVPSLKRVLELNPTYSKAYQVLAESQAKLEQRDEALSTLRTGVGVANERGDTMPRDAMAALMTELGETPPAFTADKTSPAVDVAGGDFACARCGRPSTRMEKRPFKGQLGEEVHDHVCEACWREWVGVGVKVINEMGLAMSNPEAQKIYDEHMVEFLQIQR